MKEASKDTVVVTQAYTHHRADSTGAPIAGTENADLAVVHTVAYAANKIAGWTQEYDVGRLEASRAAEARPAHRT